MNKPVIVSESESTKDLEAVAELGGRGSRLAGILREIGSNAFLPYRKSVLKCLRFSQSRLGGSFARFALPIASRPTRQSLGKWLFVGCLLCTVSACQHSDSPSRNPPKQAA